MKSTVAFVGCDRVSTAYPLDLLDEFENNAAAAGWDRFVRRAGRQQMKKPSAVLRQRVSDKAASKRFPRKLLDFRDKEALHNISNRAFLAHFDRIDLIRSKWERL